MSRSDSDTAASPVPTGATGAQEGRGPGAPCMAAGSATGWGGPFLVGSASLSLFPAARLCFVLLSSQLDLSLLL